MEEITFNCRFITPAFLGGADPKGTPELRAPSIKGALRFWWRAMHADWELSKLKKEEAELFGGMYNENGKEIALRSKVLLRVEMMEEIISKNLARSIPVKYMAYGAEERAYFDVGTHFKACFKIIEKETKKVEKIKKDVRTAFSLLTQFGGLGSKSRNGFGSFYCEESLSLSQLLKLDIIQNGEIEPKFTGLSNMVQVYQTTRTFNDYVEFITGMAKIYKDNGRSNVEKKNRHFIAAPYPASNPNTPPDRHAKIHLMSAIDTGIGLKGLITFMPYDYLSGHPDYSNNTKLSWEETKELFGEGIYNAQNRNGKYLLETLIND